MEYESEQQQQQRMAGSHYGPYAGRGKQPLDTASNDEIAQRFAHFFFRVLATEPEKVHLFYDQNSVRSHLICSRPPPAVHDSFALRHDAPVRKDPRWRMDGHRAEGTTLIHALIRSLRDQGLILTLEAVYSHGQADGSLLVAAVGLVASPTSHSNAEEEEEAHEGEEKANDEAEEEERLSDVDRPTTFVEVFVLRQKAGIGGYFVTDDMLHLLTGPLERGEAGLSSPSLCRRKLRETLEKLQEEREARGSAEHELAVVKSHLTSSGMEIQNLRQTLAETLHKFDEQQQALTEAILEKKEVEAQSLAAERELREDLNAKHTSALEHIEHTSVALEHQLQLARSQAHESESKLQSLLREHRSMAKKAALEVEEWRRTHAALKADLDLCQQNHAAVKRENTQLKSQVKSLTNSEELQVLRRRAAELEQSLQQLQQELSASKQQHAHERAEWDKKYANIKRIADDQVAKHTKKIDEADRCQRENNHLKRQEAKLEEELLAVKREAAAARDALKEKDHSRNESNTRREEGKAHGRVEEAEETETQQSRMLKAECAWLKEEVAAGQQKQEELRAAAHALKKELAAQQEQHQLQQQQQQPHQAYAAFSAAEEAAHRRAEDSGDVVHADADADGHADAVLQEMTRSRDALLAREREQEEAIKELEASKARADDEIIRLRESMETLSETLLREKVALLRDKDTLSTQLRHAQSSASSKEADARAAKEDAVAAERDLALWKDKYETSQLSISKNKILMKEQREKIEMLAADKEAVLKDLKSTRNDLDRITRDLEGALRDKKESDEMLARAEESIIDEVERSRILETRLREQMQEDEIEAREKRENLEAEIKYLRLERISYLGVDR